MPESTKLMLVLRVVLFCGRQSAMRMYGIGVISVAEMPFVYIYMFRARGAIASERTGGRAHALNRNIRARTLVAW